MAAKTTVKVATLSAAAKDDIGNLEMNTLGGALNVLGNDPGAAVLWSVYTNSAGLTNGVTPTSQVGKPLSATTAMGGTVTIINGALVYTPPSGLLTQAQLTSAQAGEVLLTDSFSYIAQMATGAMSLANVIFSIKGVNDVAVITGDAAGSVVEDTQYTDTGTLFVTDADHDQNTFTAATLTGAYGSLVMTTGGGWTYTLGTDSLWGGEGQTDTFVVTSIDGTPHTVTIAIAGADDAATFSGDDSGTVTEDTVLTTGGVLTPADVDHDQSTMQAGGYDGTYGSLAMNEDGSWSYTIGDAAQALGEGDSAVDSFTVMSFDGTTHGIDVTVVGVNDAASVGGDAEGSVVEDDLPSDSGTLTVSDVDEGEDSFVAGDSDGALGTLSLDIDGNWTYTLGAAAQSMAEGDQATDTIQVSTADGTTANVVIQVTGTNDAAEFSGDDTGTAYEDGDGAVGTLVPDDVDHDQSTMQASEQAGALGSFSMGEGGDWSYTITADVQGMGEGDEATETFTVMSYDGTEHDVVITVVGVNDVASVDSSDGSGSVTEDSGDYTVGGQLGVTDADDGESCFDAPGSLAGTYGSFSFDADTGEWSYTLDNDSAVVQALNSGDVMYDELDVTSMDGTASSTISVAVHGVDEPAPEPEPDPAEQFMFSFGDWQSSHNVFDGFTGNDTLLHSNDLSGMVLSLGDWGNDNVTDTFVTFTYKQGTPVETSVYAVLVGVSSFTPNVESVAA